MLDLSESTNLSADTINSDRITIQDTSSNIQSVTAETRSAEILFSTRLNEVRASQNIRSNDDKIRQSDLITGVQALLGYYGGYCQAFGT